MKNQSQRFLKPTYFFDYDADIIQQLISEFNKPHLTNKAKAIELYLKVRDGWTYDPYQISLSKANYRSSQIAQKPFGNCVEKSILLIAGLRAMNIPARLHLGKVKNHIAAERLIRKFGSDELTPHGMVNVYLNNKWLKLSPAFNASLCHKFKVAPLDFDGENDSYLQAYNNDGTRFMEYTADYGYFEDVPLDFMKNNVKKHYPHIFDTSGPITEFRL